MVNKTHTSSAAARTMAELDASVDRLGREEEQKLSTADCGARPALRAILARTRCGLKSSHAPEIAADAS